MKFVPAWCVEYDKPSKLIVLSEEDKICKCESCGRIAVYEQIETEDIIKADVM